jgi:hypothetical protein
MRDGVIIIVNSWGQDWPQIARAVTTVCAALPLDVVEAIYLLGTKLRWAPAEWRDQMPAPASHLPVLAPIMTSLRRRRELPKAALLVGSAQIPDFEDWADQLTFAWIKLEADSPIALPSTVATFTVNALTDLTDWILSQAERAWSVRPAVSGIVAPLHWATDRSGFPLVHVGPLNAYWQLWPLTKPQLECFAVDVSPTDFDLSWYSQLLQLNPRVSPTNLSGRPYEGLLATGLLPREVEAWARWAGPGWRAPTPAEWRCAWNWLAQQPPSVPPPELERDLAPTAQRLWLSLSRVVQPASLLALSLMCQGVIEWVQEAGRWLGMGQPRPTFDGNFRDAVNDPPLLPTPAALTRRSRLFGARLLRQ